MTYGRFAIGATTIFFCISAANALACDDPPCGPPPRPSVTTEGNVNSHSILLTDFVLEESTLTINLLTK